MVAAVVGTVVVCAYATFTLEGKRRLPGDHETLDATIADAQYMISEYVSAPVLPPMSDSWREVSALLEMHGLELVPELTNQAGTGGGMYEGPLKSWRGFVSGDPLVVFAAAKKAQKENPLYLLDYTVREGKAQLYMAVVGI